MSLSAPHDPDDAFTANCGGTLAELNMLLENRDPMGKFCLLIPQIAK